MNNTELTINKRAENIEAVKSLYGFSVNGLEEFLTDSEIYETLQAQIQRFTEFAQKSLAIH
ncbi:hypothetical protein [Achromobacter xylosoxidans]|uniref:hypothetical protein n=1 Tax=Alcaligenes xylosoxydans xylosoxydans TaxID=85698 RepID=UPI0006C26DF9|nr:hypothetical protein [Achromobacter xylosoxidans]CUJ71995.1 Uncharacterised protein [Achromobacter xylosoxidans]